MRAAVLRQTGAPRSIEEVTIDDVGPREIRIANRAVGVCYSDLHFADCHVPYPLPTVLGHESAGVVLAVGNEVRSVKPGDHVVACLALLAGAGRIIAIDRQPAKLELARRFGATDTLEAGDDVAAQVIEMTLGGVDHAIEAIGLKATVEAAFAMLAPGGTATVTGMMPIGVKVELEGFALLSERRLQGSNMGSNHFPVDIPRYADLYLQGRLNLDDLVAQHIALGEIGTTFDALREGVTARSVVMSA